MFQRFVISVKILFYFAINIERRCKNIRRRDKKQTRKNIYLTLFIYLFGTCTCTRIWWSQPMLFNETFRKWKSIQSKRAKMYQRTVNVSENLNLWWVYNHVPKSNHYHQFNVHVIELNMDGVFYLSFFCIHSFFFFSPAWVRVRIFRFLC